MKYFLNTELQVDKTTSCCLREETSSDGVLVRVMLVGRECLIALQPHLLHRWHLCCRPFEHLLPSFSQLDFGNRL